MSANDVHLKLLLHFLPHLSPFFSPERMNYLSEHSPFRITAWFTKEVLSNRSALRSQEDQLKIKMYLMSYFLMFLVCRAPLEIYWEVSG